MTRLGAWAVEGGVEFCVWAPHANRVDVVIGAPDARRVAMQRQDNGYHVVRVDGVGPGARYRFSLDGDERSGPLPDPASRWQPDDVHGDSAVIEPAFPWSDVEWIGLPLADYVIYELHVGTFTADGTFDAVIERLDALHDLGITAIELMPVAEFPGARNWGYDGVFPYAAESAYGGPDGLRMLVDAAHRRGLAVVLDVVYNHLGPEGNVLPAFGPYFTDRYRTPWGDALNFDGPGSDDVRRFFVENALSWIGDFRVDALRLDAVHAIADPSAYPFVEELTDAVHRFADEHGRLVHVIAESAANDARLITPKEHGGIGCDAQWDDDFHHALHALLTGERHDYYVDYGAPSDLATAFEQGFVYANRYSPFHGRRHGRPPGAVLPGQRFVVFDQNHDQVGNRAAGDRISTQVGDDGVRLAAVCVLCSPFLPLLFMGEEYGETNPFPYFVSHSDPALVEAVRRGRRAEFASLAEQEPPDPQAEATFAHAKLDWSKRTREPHASLLEWYRALLALRANRPALRVLDASLVAASVFDEERAIVVSRSAPDDAVVIVLGFGDVPHDVEILLGGGAWTVLLDTHADERGLPDAITGDADGRLRLKLPPCSAVVLGLGT
ncbi:MAG TPA: malto-oligosyltrehalose trehalohydrolase [Acidimicrobiia bacterium]|nr:malto-oligosyltrehalose trehalohydrolase [Acidimicrobiia bacterium]